jgi:hypothetical protein
VSVVLVSSPILGNAYPTPTDMQLSDHATAINDVVSYYAPDGGTTVRDGGRSNVHVSAAILDKLLPSGTGCGGHPGVAQQTAAAAKIVPVIKAAMNW